MTSIALNKTLREHNARVRRQRLQSKSWIGFILLGVLIGMFISAVWVGEMLIK